MTTKVTDSSEGTLDPSVNYSSGGGEQTIDEILGFLCGENPLDGYWFGDTPESLPKFWWRKKLRKSLAELIDNKVLEARKDELNNLSYETAKNGWHKDKSYKIWEYVIDRIASLTKEISNDSL